MNKRKLAGGTIALLLIVALRPQKVSCRAPGATCTYLESSGTISVTSYEIQPLAISWIERSMGTHTKIYYTDGEDRKELKRIQQDPQNDMIPTAYDLVVSETAVGGWRDHIFTLGGIRTAYIGGKELYSINIEIDKEYNVTLQVGETLTLDEHTTLVIEAIIPAPPVAEGAPSFGQGKVYFSELPVR